MGNGQVPFGEIDGNIQMEFVFEQFDLIDGLLKEFSSMFSWE